MKLICYQCRSSVASIPSVYLRWVIMGDFTRFSCPPASVPIWKKEVYTNGEIWKENSEFMEKRMELAKAMLDQGKICRESKVKATHHVEKGCCGGKDKVNDETAT
ncbi:hypothetical protein Leryth_027050 [Lithospermum erythrorhizon]|nr:hypothetical protein Leryth_027050 [Lithospermum erythrorhizon]